MTKNKHKQVENNEDASTYLGAFKERYIPVCNQEDSTHRFSTTEIFEAIKRLNPGAKITQESVYESLINEGYTYFAVPGIGIQFKWFVKEIM